MRHCNRRAVTFASFLSVFPPFWVLESLSIHLKNLWAIHVAENPLDVCVQRSSYHLGSMKLLGLLSWFSADLWFFYVCHWKEKSHFYCWVEEGLCPSDSVCRNKRKSISRGREGEEGSHGSVGCFSQQHIKPNGDPSVQPKFLDLGKDLHWVFLRKVLQNFRGIVKECVQFPSVSMAGTLPFVVCPKGSSSK